MIVPNQIVFNAQIEILDSVAKEVFAFFVANKCFVRLRICMCVLDDYL